jgi:hypothetical protein
MYPRTEYEMTDDDLQKILEACKPTVVMKIGNYVGASPQENANRAWASLGEKMGFDYMTVRPIPGKGERYFSAVPSETAEQKTERLAREVMEKRQAAITRLTAEIADRQAKLDELLKPA